MKIFEYNKCYCLNDLSFDHGPRLFHINLIYRTYPNQEICYPLIQRVGYAIDCYQYNNEYFSVQHDVISKTVMAKTAISKIHLPTAIIAITMIAIKPCST